MNARPHRWAVAALILLATWSLAAACSSGSKGPGVANLGSPTTGSSSGGGKRAGALAYSQCMRAHGLPDYPDPNSNGEIQINIGPGSDLDQNNPRYKAAEAACKSLLPAQGSPPKGVKAANLKYARCMRDHGIKDFPDPNPDGTLQVQATPGSDLDPNNPLFKKANDACKSLQPGGGAGGGSLSTGGA
jgi:hypothetical protein